MAFKAVEALKDAYSRYADYLESKGIPPLPATIVFLTVLIILVGFSLSFLSKAPPLETVSVTVYSENGEAVPDARVQLYDEQGNFLDEQKSDAQGLAHFTGVNVARVVVKVLKQGFEPGSTVSTRSSVTVALASEAPLPSTETLRIALFVTDQETLSPISGAQVSYSSKRAAASSATTDAQGKAVLVAGEGRTVNVRVTHSQYEDKALSFLAKKGVQVEAKLQKRKGGQRPGPTPTPGPLEYGTLEVSVKDPSGNAVSGATVNLYDASTDSKIASQETREGKSVFEDLLVGSRVYLTARAEGFLPFSGTDRILVQKRTRHEISLRTQALTDSFKVRTLNDEGNLTASAVSLYTTTTHQLVLRKDSRGEVSFTLQEIQDALGGLSDSSTDVSSLSFYVSANAPSRLPAFTSDFNAPFSQDYSLLLSSASPENSAVLTVETQDASRAKLPQTEVRVLKDARVLASKKSDFNAKASFTLPVNETYLVEEVSGGQKGYGKIFLSQDSLLEVFLSDALSFLLVSAFDLQSNAPVYADFSLAVSSQPFDSCSGYSCYLRIRRFSSGNLSAFAAGYVEYTTEIPMVVEEEKELPIYLVNSETAPSLLVKWLGVADVLGQNATELLAGQSYTAKVLVSSKDAQQTGVFFRVGDAVSLEEDIAEIISYSTLKPPLSSKNSTTYVPSSTCTQTPPSPKSPSFKWLELTFDGTLTQDVSFLFTVKENVKAKTALSLHYRAFAVTNEGYVRLPEDEGLGLLADSPSKSGCYAASFKETLPLLQEKEFKCRAAGCLSATLEQDGFVVEQGLQARSIAGCDEECGDCENACDASALAVHLDFEPSPSFSKSPFLFQVASRSGLVDFKKFSVNNQPYEDSASSSARGTLEDASYFRVNVLSWPVREGEESISVEVWPEGREDQKVSASLSLTVMPSCGRGKRICPDGSCQYLCFDAFTATPTPTPYPTPEPCPQNQARCLDGICRGNCGAIGTPSPTPTPLSCTSDEDCFSGWCDFATNTCADAGLPTPTPEPLSCSQAGGSCVGNCGDFDDCSPVSPSTNGICSSGVCCTGSCAVPSSCNYNSDCPSGECNQATGTCVPTQPQSNARCSLDADRSTLSSGQSALVQVSYSGFASPLYVININCGNGKTASATNCAGTAGECRALCNYPSQGSFSLSSSISGVSCTQTFVDVSTSQTPSSCTSSLQCGLDGYVGDAFCQDGNLYANYEMKDCLAPGQTTSRCTSSTQPRLIQSCSNGCSNSACVAGGGPEPTPRPGIGIDIVGGRLTSRTSSIELKVDAVFPADIAHFDLTPSCRQPLFSVRSNYSSCYSVENNFLIFRGKPLNGNCELDLKGGKLSPDTGSYLELACPGDASNTLQLPIRLSIDNSIPSTYAVPETLEGSSSKLFHIISETQGARRLSLNNMLNADFLGAGAQSFAWSGDGLLEVFENEGKAASLLYTPTETYYQDISDQGGRVEQCSDFLCCAKGWCTSSAAAGAFSAFRQASENIAKATAFRSSHGLPLTKVTENPFVYTTIIRLIQGAKLPATIRVLDSPSTYGCKDDGPAVYEIAASTFDGKAWTYEARISRLYRYQYVNAGTPPACPASPQTPSFEQTDSFQQQSSGGYLALCNFLTGKPECIDSQDEANLASAEQLEKKEQLIPIPIPSSFWQIPFKKAACHAIAPSETAKYTAAIRACDAAYAADVAVCHSIAAACVSSCSVCPGPCGSCTPGCYADETACLAAALEKKYACKWTAWEIESTATQIASNTITAAGTDLDLPGVFPYFRQTHLTCACLVGGPEPYYSPPGEGIVTCTTACIPRRSYPVTAMCGNQLYAIIHAGVDLKCDLDYMGIGVSAASVAAQYKYPEYKVYVNMLAAYAATKWGVQDLETPGALKLLEKISPIPLSNSPALMYFITSGVENVFYTQACNALGA